ncbi:Vacuolar protein sorting-associated protein 13C [Nymphon striatum]|nr:Vacuolar protein sorting-associated protein 13C [Nymphon striatum]
MFEGVVASILNKYLGKYVQNLDTENLNLGIFSGTVELTELKLKPEALYELNLPIEVKAGTIGKISLDIPWTSLYSEPVIVNVEDVFLLAGPITDRDYDPELERLLLRAEKRKKLEDLAPTSTSATDDDDESKGFFERLTATIVNNLQIAVRNVHIRYEDVVTDKNFPLACGIMLQSITASTTNSKWKPSQLDANASTIFKLIKMESLSIYWNPNCSHDNLTRSFVSTNMWKNIMNDGLATFSVQNEDFDFMVKPISAKVKVILSKSNDAKVPKLLVDFLLQDAASQFSREQYVSVLKLIQSIQRMGINKQYLKYRPTVPLKKNAKKWWHYAYTSIAEVYIRPYSWERIKKHRQYYRQYKNLYKEKLLKPNDAEIKLDLQKLEDHLDVANILLAREHAKLEFAKEEPERVKRKKESGSSWWSSLFGGSSDEEEYIEVVGEDTAIWSKLTPEEKEKLYEAIGYTEGEMSLSKPVQYIEHKLNFTLANCALSLIDQNREILVMTLTQFLMSVETRPSADAFRLSARTESFVVEGASVEHDLVPIITADHATSGTNATHVFAFDFEKNPLHVESDFGLSLNAEPMEMVYHEHSISEVISYFTVKSSLIKNVTTVAKQKLYDLAETSKLGLLYAIEQHKKIFVNIDLKSPYVVVPDKGTLQKGDNILILDLGRLTIKSDMQHGAVSLEDATRMEIEERLYDRFNIVLSDIQMLFVDSGESWRETRLLPESESHIMPKMRIQLMLSNNVKPDYKQIPRQLVEFANTFPLPNFNPVHADEVDSKVTDEEPALPDAETMNLVISTAYLKKIKNQVLSVGIRPSKDAVDHAREAPIKIKSKKEVSTPSDHSDDEPEEWARMVDLPGFDDNVSPSNIINTLLRFLIGEVVIQLGRSSDHTDKPYLMLRINKLCTDIALMEYGIAAQASVGGIQLVDKLHRDCPEFKSHFHYVEQSLVLDVTMVSATFHRGAFITLSKFLQYVLEKVKLKEQKSKRSSFVPSVPDPSTLLMSGENDPPVPSGATKLSVSARIDQVKIKLCDSDMDFAELKVSGVETDFVRKANEKMIFRANLTNVSLIDLTESTLYPKILSIEDDKVFEFKELLRSLIKCTVTGSVRLRVGRIQVVLLYKFITDFYRFIEPFIQPEVTMKAVKSAGKTVQKQVTDIKVKGTRLSLSIDIHAPTLLIPQKSSSPNLLAMMLGDLSIENFFKEVAAPNGGTKSHIVDNLLIRLNSVQMSRAVIMINGAMETQESILEPVKLRIDIKRAIMPFQHDVLLYDIQGSLDVIKINIGQRDLGTILAIYKENFYEGQFSDSRPPSRPLSPVGIPTPVTTESEDVKKLEAFLNTSVDIHREISVSFVLEGVQLSLYKDSEEVLSSPLRDASYGLSKFEMGEVSFYMSILNDRAMELKCALQAVTLYDIREDSSLAVRKIFQSYSGDSKEMTGPISISMPPMIDVTYRQTNTGDAAVDILIERTRLNVSISYILAISKFFYEALPDGSVASTIDGSIANVDHTNEQLAGQGIKLNYIEGRKRHPSDITSGYHSTASASSPLEDSTGLSISAKLKKPEIILFADPTDHNSKVLVLKDSTCAMINRTWTNSIPDAINSEVNVLKEMIETNIYFDYSRNLGQENLVGSISGLKIFSCVYGKRKQTANMVLQPCDAEFTRSMKSSSDDIDMTANLGNVTLKISSSTVHTVMEVVEQFLQVYEGSCVRPQYPTTKSNETITVQVPSVDILFEVEDTPHRIPYIAIHSAFEAEIHDWSKQMYMKMELQLEIMYYNEKLALWEPIIEPVMESETNYRPWEVIVKIFKDRGHPISCQLDEVDNTVSHSYSKAEMASLTSQKMSEDQSSESEADSDNNMTIVKKTRASFKRPNGSMSRDNSSLVGGPADSDSETEEGMLEKITNAFSHLFSSADSSDELTNDSEDEASFDTKANANASEDGTDVADLVQLSPDDMPVFINMSSTDKGMDVPDAAEESVENMATYVLIDTRDKHTQLDIGSEKTLYSPIENSPPLDLKNFLGPSSSVQIIKSAEGAKDIVLVSSSDQLDSNNAVTAPSTGMLVDISPSDSDADIENEEYDGYSVISATSQVSQAVNGIKYEDDISVLYEEKIEEKIILEMDGFEKLVCLLPRMVVTRVYALQPLKQQLEKTRYHVAVDLNVHHGIKHITVRSLLKMENNLDTPVHIYCKKSALDSLGLPSPPSKNPFQDNIKLTTLAPGQIYNVPLYVAYHCKLFVQPSDIFNDSTPRYQTCGTGISWQELISLPINHKHFTCKPTTNSGSNFIIKVAKVDNVKFQSINNKQVPNYTLSLNPPLVFHNHLPTPLELIFKETDEKYELSAGQQCPITLLDNSNSQIITVEVMQYLGIPWTGSLEIYLNMEEHKTITMKTDHDTEGGNKQLSINVKVKNVHCLNLYLYVPYWIVNKTKLPLQFRGSGSDVIYESNSCDDPLLFRFKKLRKKKARLRVYNSAWSPLFSLDTVGSSGVVICSDKERSKKYQFLMDIQFSKLQLSKIITITPYFLIINNTKRDMMYMEENIKTDLWLDLSSDQCLPFWPDTSSMKLYVRYKDSKSFSSHFPINRTHTTVLRMDNGSGLCVEVMGGLKSSVIINLQPYVSGLAPVRVENMCEDLFVKFRQKNMSQVQVLSSYQSMLYTWDDPVEKRILLWSMYNQMNSEFEANIFSDAYGQEKVTIQSVKTTSQANQSSQSVSVADSSSDDDDSDTEQKSVHKSKIRKDKVVVHWVSYIDGHQRVLLFTQDERVAKQARKNIDEISNLEVFFSLGDIGLSLINGLSKEVGYMSISSPPAIWEVEINGKMKLLNVELSTWLEDNFVAEQGKAELKDYIHVDFSKMSMTKPFFGKLKRTYNPALWFQYRQSEHQMYVHTKIHRIQIDNQLPDAVFPTVFWPAPLPQYIIKKNGNKPLIEFAAMRILTPGGSINNFKFVKLLIQEFNIRLDKGFLLTAYDSISNIFETEDEVKQMKSDLMSIHMSLKEMTRTSTSSQPQRLMIDYLHMSPIKMSLSFSLRGTVYKSKLEDPSFSQDIVDFFLESVGATFSEVKDVELKMAFLEVRYALMSPEQLLDEVKSHYISQIIQQSYVLILGLDVLGNPYGLIKDFTKGLGDFFYEPFLGSIQGPEGFAIGISRGAQSLFGHIIGGTAESVSLVSGSLGQALSVLSFDEDYKKKRRLRLHQYKDNLPATLTMAAKGFVLGVSLGLSGVIVKPISGAQQEGVEGFFKGIGKGLLGLITKPAVGVFDMVSMAFDGIRRAAEMGEDVVSRYRLPRFINLKLGLKPFSPYQATGYNLLLNLSKGHYAEMDTYWVHAALSRDDRADVALITDRHVFLLERCKFWGGWDIEWQLRIDDIMSVPHISDKKLIFKVKKEETISFFLDDEKYIACDDKLVLKWLRSKLEKVLMMNIEDKPCPQKMLK